MKKVVLGLSGGVDSALSAAILKNQGYSITGIYLKNGSGGEDDAKKVAENFGIDFVSLDIKEDLEKHVISPFIESYLNGKTPIPCILCNPLVKFKYLFDYADKIGAQYVSTGHYAKIDTSPDGEKLLSKALSKNDQSYMLYRLPKKYINRLILPLGEYVSKDEVRAQAEHLGIHIAQKSDSMEICFIPNDDHGAFIENRIINLPKGNFVDENGKILAEHLGIHRYTVGQRRGLGISAPSRLFVKDIDVQNNNIIISDKDIYKESIEVSSKNIIYDKYKNLDEFECHCKIRHSKTEYKALVKSYGDGFKVFFTAEPARAPSPGQSAVFYEGDYVIGGGFIEK